MKVRFVQSGGFAGITKGCEFDAATLSPKLTREIETLIQGSKIPGFGTSAPASGRDLRQYEIIIEEGDRKIDITFDDSTIPELAKTLLGFLKRNARPGPPT
jgi:hypothetical protein